MDATLLDVLCCFRLHTLLHPHVVAQTLKPFIFYLCANGHNNSQNCWVGQKFCVCLHRAFLVSLFHVIKTVHAVFSANENPSKGHEFKSFASFVSNAT